MQRDPLQVPPEALRAVLRFASLPSIETTAQVHDLLRPAAAALGSKAPFLQLGADESPQPFRDNQAMLRGWLATLGRWRRTSAKDRQRVLDEVADWAGKAHATLATVVRDGNIRRELTVHANGVQSVVGETFARLLADDARRAAVIGQCPVCKSYFLKVRSDAKTCSDRCRVAKHRKES